jgi:hypothetical protein
MRIEITHMESNTVPGTEQMGVIFMNTFIHKYFKIVKHGCSDSQKSRGFVFFLTMNIQGKKN